MLRSDAVVQGVEGVAGGAGGGGAGGAPLPHQVRLAMEQSLGSSFSDVRVHEGFGEGVPAMQARASGARAYAQGNDLHFAPGAYNPHSPTGQELLGHELTHVVQQRAGRVAAPQF